MQGARSLPTGRLPKRGLGRGPRGPDDAHPGGDQRATADLRVRRQQLLGTTKASRPQQAARRCRRSSARPSRLSPIAEDARTSSHDLFAGLRGSGRRGRPGDVPRGDFQGAGELRRAHRVGLRTSTGKVLQSRAAPELLQASSTATRARRREQDTVGRQALRRRRRGSRPTGARASPSATCRSTSSTSTSSPTRQFWSPGSPTTSGAVRRRRGGAGAGLRGRQPARGRVGGRACGVLPAWKRSRTPRRRSARRVRSGRSVDDRRARGRAGGLGAHRSHHSATARARHRRSTRSAVLSSQASAGGQVPNGVYRFEITDDDLPRGRYPLRSMACRRRRLHRDAEGWQLLLDAAIARQPADRTRRGWLRRRRHVSR